MKDPYLRRIVLLQIAVVALSACEENLNGPEVAWAYRVTAGACGHLTFAEKLGPDSASAVEAVKARKIEMYGEGVVTLELYPLQVVDKHGKVPQERFYAVGVLDAETGTHVHSVSEVIATDGDLFTLAWCPD